MGAKIHRTCVVDLMQEQLEDRVYQTSELVASTACGKTCRTMMLDISEWMLLDLAEII